MSGYLAGKVWQSALAPHLKPLAAALADIANDDGTRIYPSVGYVAWLLGRSDRAVQDGLAELKAAGVLKVLAYPKGGRGHATHYQMIETALPDREPWRKGESVAPFIGKGEVDDVKGAESSIKGAVSDERVQITTLKGEAGCTRTVREPSLEPLIEPLNNPEILSSKEQDLQKNYAESLKNRRVRC